MATVSQKKRKKDVKLSIKNLGPIESGKVDIKPLTVFIGENQSGKSYLSLLIYSIFTSPNNDLIVRSNKLIKNQNFIKLNKEFNKFISENLPEEALFDIPEQFIKKIFDYNINLYSESIFSRLIKLTYSKKIQNISSFENKDLFVDINTGGFKIKLTSSDLDDYGNDNLYQKMSFKFQINTDIIDSNYVDESGEERISLSIGISDKKDEPISFKYNIHNYKSIGKGYNFKEIMFNQIFESLNVVISERIKSINYRPTYYFPAGRAGILQGYRLFTHQMYGIMSSPDISQINEPLVSGNLSEFMALISSLATDKKSTPFKDEVREFESKILNGETYLKRNESYIDSEIRFKTNYGIDMPLLRASSTVSELAPLFLLLKNRVRKHDTIIIEEIEAHLHPKNQEKIAALIVSLIRNEINVIMTTHSDYLLERLNHYLLISELVEQERKDLGYSLDLYLNPNEVSVNLLKKKRGKESFLIKNLKLDPIEGIPQDEFRDISTNLYSNTIDILEKVQNKYE